jgi:hypothetical protein
LHQILSTEAAWTVNFTFASTVPDQGIKGVVKALKFGKVDLFFYLTEVITFSRE